MYELDRLFSPITIKGKTIKNRCLVTPMVTDYCDNEGKATEKFIAYHEEKAKGGWGVIITEDYAVDSRGRGFQNVAGLWCDDQIESHRELTRRVHQYGAVILAQIYHSGRQTNAGAIGQAPVAPSAIACPFGTDVPEPLSTEGVWEIIGKFGDAALRAKKAGFDGVMIHGGHGYLISQFMSPYSNKRVDEFGGSFMNRMRFPLEIIRDIRKKCGEDFILDMRLSGQENVEGGLNIEDMKVIAPMLEEAGLDMMHISVGVYLSHDDNSGSSYYGHGCFTDYAQEIKKVVNIPVAAVLRINDPFLAESMLRQGKCDLVGMGRQSLCDPATPKKAEEGRFEDIRRCVGCNMGCITVLFGDKPIRCILNPELGREWEGGIKPAAFPKKVAIIGAGPAGLWAAIAARKAGHMVTVFEQRDHAGGQFYLASVPPAKGECADFIVWQTTQCQKLGVDIRYNTKVTVEMMKEMHPDVIIAATGANPNRIPLPGADKPHVYTAHEVLDGKMFPGQKCVIIGGGHVGCETAHFLAQMKREVTILEVQDEIGAGIPIGTKWQLMKMLDARGVVRLPGATVKEITDTEVLAAAKTHPGQMEAEELSFPADTVIFAVGSRPNRGLADKLLEEGFDVRVIGDAKQVRQCLDATTEGYLAGRDI